MSTPALEVEPEVTFEAGQRVGSPVKYLIAPGAGYGMTVEQGHRVWL